MVKDVKDPGGVVQPFMGWVGNEGADINGDVSPVSSPVTVSSHRGEFNEAKLEAVSLAFASCRLCPLLQLCK